MGRFLTFRLRPMVHIPKPLALGHLETEILNILWSLEDSGIKSASVKDIHDRILADPERELAYTSVTTVLRRLTKKGWLTCDKDNRAFRWRPLVTREQAQALQAQTHLQQFLAIGDPDIVAAFADHLDTASLDKLEAIAQRLRAARSKQEDTTSQ
jgi:predicted transcriptional regulator